MRVLVSGSSGFVGRALLSALAAAGHQPLRLVRSNPGRMDVAWNPAGSAAPGPVFVQALDHAAPDAVVHLAGAPIAARRWSTARKKEILESRTQGTRYLSDALTRMKKPPRVLVSASAIGFYGDRGEEILTEESPVGSGFLPYVARAWEEAAGPAADAGIRVALVRIGLVLGREGGALKTMLPAFRLCLGGPLGNGEQYMSWITLDDLIRALLFVLQQVDLRGPVNAVAPYAVMNADFARTLGRVLGRPAVLPAPEWALRLMAGEMADALLLASTRVQPMRLKDGGFVFKHPVLEDALRDILLGS